MTTDPELVDNVWVPGELADLTAGSLKKVVGAQCPWAFLVLAAAKAFKNKPQFGPAEVMRNNYIPLYDKVTSKHFTLKSALLAYNKLSLFVFLKFEFCFYCIYRGITAVNIHQPQLTQSHHRLHVFEPVEGSEDSDGLPTLYKKGGAYETTYGVCQSLQLGLMTTIKESGIDSRRSMTKATKQELPPPSPVKPELVGSGVLTGPVDQNIKPEASSAFAALLLQPPAPAAAAAGLPVFRVLPQQPSPTLQIIQVSSRTTSRDGQVVVSGTFNFQNIFLHIYSPISNASGR